MNLMKKIDSLLLYFMFGIMDNIYWDQLNLYKMACKRHVMCYSYSISAYYDGYVWNVMYYLVFTECPHDSHTVHHLTNASQLEYP